MWVAAIILSAGIALSIGGVAPAVTAQTGRPLVPRFEPDPLWSQPLPNKWVTGQVGGVAVDVHDHLWVFHRPATIADGEKGAALNPPQAECCIPAPPVLEFDTTGKLLQAWGGPAPGVEWPASEHGIFVDHNDQVWLSGNARADNQILKYSRRGQLLLQIGHAGQNTGSNDTVNLGGPAGLFVHRKTNELFVADGYFNHRVIAFDAATGAYKRHWGAYGKPPDDRVVFPPRAQLIQGPPPVAFNNPVHAVWVSQDDMVYVADRSNNRLQVFGLDGTFIREVFVTRNTLQNEGTVHALATSPDRDETFLYVVDGSNKAIRVLNRRTLEIVSTIGGHAGRNAREFFHAHGLARDSKGNLYIGEVNTGQRYYRYAFKGMGPADR
jgi:hypothetical protein